MRVDGTQELPTYLLCLYRTFSTAAVEETEGEVR